MTVETIVEQRACGGRIGAYRHASKELGLEATFGVFLPAQALAGQRVPVIHLLAGLTCNQETFLIKSNVVRFAAEHGMALIAPDTSPRGARVSGEDESWDFGTGAAFYLDATVQPWAAHYRMGSYVGCELPALTEALFPIDSERRGIMGHSMGGHGALVHGLKAPGFWKSVSAFAPICNPSVVPWGIKAMTAYLGPDRATWSAWDATELLRSGHRHPSAILIDQGDADEFLARQLQPEHLEVAAHDVRQPMTVRRQPGYDHSYWFIQSFVEDHMDHHASILKP